MKEAEDSFDKALRQKLQGASTQPPGDVFDKVVGEKEKKRRFGWFFLLLLLIPGWLILGPEEIQHNGQQDANSLKDETVSSNNNFSNNAKLQSKSETKIEASGTSQNAADAASLETPAVAASSASGSGLQKSQDGNAGYLISASTTNKNSSKHRQGKSKTTSGNYTNNPKPNSTTNNKAMAYGKLPTDETEQRFYIYPVNVLPSGNYGLSQYPVMHKPLTGLQEHQLTPSPFSLEFSIGAIFPAIDEEAASNDSVANRLISEKNNHRVVRNGMNLELNGTYLFKSRISLGAGIGYSRFEEQSDFVFNEYYSSLDIDTIQYYILFPFTPSILVTKYDTSIVTLTNMRQINHKVSIQSSSINLFARYSIPVGSFTVEPQIGSIIVLVSTFDGNGNANPEFVNRKDDAIYDNDVEVSLTGSVGVCYTWNERLGLFMRTGYSAGLSSFAGAPGLSTLTKNQFSAGAGVRWNFVQRQAAKAPSGGSEIVKQ